MKHNKEKGAEIAELAVALPLLVFLALGAIEGGSMLRVHQLLNNAAREGTRMAITQNVAYAANRDTVIQNVVSNYLTNNNALPGSGTFTLGECATWNAGTNVTTNWPFQPGGTLPATGAITGTLTLASGSTVTTSMAQVTVTCAYKFFFLPTLPGLRRQPTVSLQGQTTMMDLF
ncbi:MAG TPA: TadE/TadG family type IV pilus assembly protein [Terriglobales bacterium]|jgi:Flp pilus assembly protein TadG|nr:TadE/TadG family type IV pilus assembly protein [Terriglobales bacterium]